MIVEFDHTAELVARHIKDSKVGFATFKSESYKAA